MVKIELDVAGRRVKSKFNNLIKMMSTALLDILSEEDRRNFTKALESTASIMTVESDQMQELFGSMIEPLKITLTKQFRKRQKSQSQ